MHFIRRVDRAWLSALGLAAVVSGALAGGGLLAERGAGAAEAVIPPLCDAAYRGDLRRVRDLLRTGVAVDAKFDGETALMKALEPFIGPAGVGPPPEKGRSTAAQRAVNKIAIAQLLITAGADVRLAGPNRATALHLAALAPGSEDALASVVRNLIRRGALVDAQMSAHTTPLQLAVWKKRFGIAKILVEAGASLDGRDNHGKSAADELVAQGSERVLEELRSLAEKRH